MIKLTALVFKDEDMSTLIKKPAAVNPENITYMVEVNQRRNLPIIGEENDVTFTQVTFVKDPPLMVMETVEEMLGLIASHKAPTATQA